MSENPRDDEGRFGKRVRDSDIVRFVRRTDNCTAPKVGEEFGISRQGADYRLRQLAEAGRVEIVEHVGPTNVWDAR